MNLDFERAACSVAGGVLDHVGNQRPLEPRKFGVDGDGQPIAAKVLRARDDAGVVRGGDAWEPYLKDSRFTMSLPIHQQRER